jgi:DNA-dependent RNA polymerase auxiliary subunit epsilon
MLSESLFVEATAFFHLSTNEIPRAHKTNALFLAVLSNSQNRDIFKEGK